MTEDQVADAPKPRARRDARANRQRLLGAAKELFSTHEISATSMHEIAQAAGVGQGTLYRHFADKGEICHALIKEDLAAFQERVGAVIGSTWVVASPLTRLDMLIVEHIRLTESHLPLFAAMDSVAGARRPKPFRGPFGAWLHTQIMRLLAEAVAQSEVVDLDVAFTADAILAAIAPALYHYQRHELGYQQERIIVGMRRLFIGQLRHGSPASPRASY